MPSYASVAIGMSAREQAEPGDLEDATRRGRDDEVRDQHREHRHDEDDLGRERVPVEDRSGKRVTASSTVSLLGQLRGRHAVLHVGDGGLNVHGRLAAHGGIGDAEDDVREDAERRRSARRIGTQAVHSNAFTSWMCASANSAFGTPNATFWSIQSR